jgi:hypothetical protein
MFYCHLCRHPNHKLLDVRHIWHFIREGLPHNRTAALILELDREIVHALCWMFGENLDESRTLILKPSYAVPIYYGTADDHAQHLTRPIFRPAIPSKN